MGPGSGEGQRPQQMFNSFLTVSAPFLLVFMYNFGIFLLQLKEVKGRGSSCSCWQLILQFLMRETVRREALWRRGENNCTVILYCIYLGILVHAGCSQPKYMYSHTHDQNTGSFRKQGKEIYIVMDQ